MMRLYFMQIYSDDAPRYNELISSGCFTFKFVSQLLLLIPPEELMSMNTQIMGVDHVKQVHLYLTWSQTRLQALYSLRNLNTADPGASTQHVPSGGASQAIVNKGELKRLKNQIRQELLSEGKLPVMTTGIPQASAQHRTPNTGQNTSKSNYSPRSAGSKNNAVEMNTVMMNDKILSLFSLIYSGKPVKNIPVLKDMGGQVPESMDFAKCETLITHSDFQSTQFKQALVFCMGHRLGCLVCLHILNKTGSKWKVFPHHSSEINF